MPTCCCTSRALCDTNAPRGFDASTAQAFENAATDLGRVEKVALLYLLGFAGYSLEQAQQRRKHLVLYETCLFCAARSLFDACHLHSIPEGLHDYIDYEKYALHLKQRGELVELMLGQHAYTINAGAL